MDVSKYDQVFGRDNDDKIMEKLISLIDAHIAKSQKLAELFEMLKNHEDHLVNELKKVIMIIKSTKETVPAASQSWASVNNPLTQVDESPEEDSEATTPTDREQ